MERISFFKNQKISFDEQRKIMGGDTGQESTSECRSDTNTKDQGGHSFVTDKRTEVWTDMNVCISSRTVNCE